MGQRFKLLDVVTRRPVGFVETIDDLTPRQVFDLFVGDAVILDAVIHQEPQVGVVGAATSVADHEATKAAAAAGRRRRSATP